MLVVLSKLIKGGWREHGRRWWRRRLEKLLGEGLDALEDCVVDLLDGQRELS
jgi:hypothetical protein